MKKDTKDIRWDIYAGRRSRLILFLTILLCSVNSSAYVYWVCGDKKLKPSNNHIAMNMSRISFPGDSPELGAMIRAIIHWHVNPSKLTLAINTGDNSVGLDNGQCEAWASSPENFENVDGNRAVTMWEYNCSRGEITESDIIFNTEIDWTFSRSKYPHTLYGGSRTPLEGIAVHELGHAVGLDHETRTYNIMYGFGHAYLNDDNVIYYAGEDAVNGAVFLMGMKSTRWQDVAAVHWKILDGFGMFRTMVYTVQPTWNAGDWPVPADNSYSVYDGFTKWRDGDPNLRFNVKNGQRIWPEFTYENNGADAQNISVGYYLSEDDIITAADIRLGGRNMTLSRDWVTTHSYGVNLPGNLVEGRDYYIGAIVDEDNRIDEFVNELNNNVATGLHIVPVIPASISFSPSIIRGGQSSTATVTLDGAASTSLLLAVNAYPNGHISFPSSITLPAGSHSASFEVQTDEIYGSGHQQVDFTVSRAGAGSASGVLYIERRDVSNMTFCEVHPESIICILREFKDERNPFYNPDGNPDEEIPVPYDDMYGDKFEW